MISLVTKAVALFRALASLYVVLICITYQGVVEFTNAILPNTLNLLIAILFASPLTLFFPSIICAILGVAGIGLWSYWNIIRTAVVSFWPKDQSLFSLTEFTIKAIAALYKLLIYPFPFLVTLFIPAPEPGPGIFNAVLRSILKDPCRHYPPSETQMKDAKVKDEIWIFINGVATTKEIADQNCNLIFEMFGRPVDLLHNPTDGLVVDLFECAAGKTGLFQFGEIEPREELKILLILKLIEAKEKGYKKVVLLAHSQGTIITGNALYELGSTSSTDFLNEYIRRELKARKPDIDMNMVRNIAPIMKELLEVYSFATCGHKMPAENCSYLENISNKGDLVAYLGQFFPFPNFWIDVHGNPISLSGKCLAEEGDWGHLINSHYLYPMKNRGMFPESKLMKEYYQGPSPGKMLTKTD